MTWGHLADILVSFSVPLISHILLTSSLTTDACIQYEYSGCGGNSNTFVTEEVFFLTILMMIMVVIMIMFVGGEV